MHKVLCAGIGMILLGAGCASTGPATVAVAPEPVEDENAGFITLFDGTSTEGWAVYHEEPGGGEGS